MTRFLTLGAVLGLAACSSTPIQEVNERYRQVLLQRETEYRLKPGDSISLKFFNQDQEINQTLLVLPDGRTDPFFMDDLVVAGKTVKQLEEDIRRYYADQVISSEVSVQIIPAGETIILEGEVVRPSTQPLTMKMTLMQALGNAGGYKLTACLHTIIIRRSFLDEKHPDVFRINLRKYADVPEELFLLPNDHIIVERNWVILVQDYIEQYVWGFLPPFFSYPLGYLAALL